MCSLDPNQRKRQGKEWLNSVTTTSKQKQEGEKNGKWVAKEHPERRAFCNVRKKGKRPDNEPQLPGHKLRKKGGKGWIKSMRPKLS